MTSMPPSLPEGEGMAARYPGDRGIQDDPAVAFADDFETTQTGVIPSGYRRGDEKNWDNSWGACLVTEKPESVHSGRKGLEFTLVWDPAGRGGGLAVQKFLGEGFDTLFLRYYARFGADTELYHGGAHNGACIAARAPGVPQSCPGMRADGSNKITVVLDTWRPREEVPSPGDLVTYVYHMDQGGRWGDQFFPSGRVNPPGRELFGEHFVPREDFIPERGRRGFLRHGRTGRRALRLLGRHLRTDVGRGRDDVVVAHRHVAPDPPVLGAEAQIEAVELQRVDVAQAQVGEVGPQLPVHPEGDSAVTLARRIRLDHQLIAVPAAPLRDEVLAGDEVLAE